MKKLVIKSTVIMLASLLAITLTAGLSAAEKKLVVQDGAATDVFSVDDTGTVTAGGFLGLGDITVPNVIINAKGSDTYSSQLLLQREQTHANGGAGFVGYHNNANYGLPTSGNRLGYFLFGSFYEDVAGQYGAPGFLWAKNGAGISARAEGDWTYTSTPAYFTFETAPVGSTARAERMKIGSDGVIKINGLSGSGNAYACIDASGNLFRSTSPCN